MPNIFDYSNYRSFLNDYYLEKNKKDKKFSHRFFASKIGLNSTGFFSDVLKGNRNLTLPLILKFSKALKLKKDEQNYFENLVNFNQAKSADEKNNYYEKILSFKNIRADIIGKDQYEFYSKWYYSAIRELLYFYKFKNDYRSLAKKLNPSIRMEQAKKAVKILERTNLIKKDKKGYYKQTSSFITTGKEFQPLNIHNFQTANMELAKQALERHPKDKRDISTLTLTLSESSFKNAKQEIEKLRKKLLLIAEQDKKVDRVYQANFQLFPLTKF